jgi:Fe2+ or Zn2+ uptake regulation protein
MSKRNTVVHALNHSTRRRIIEALWHSHESLTAAQFHSDYVDDERVGLDQIVYHVRQLDKDGIVELTATVARA